jgi:hypothetical protein
LPRTKRIAMAKRIARKVWTLNHNNVN